jgi:hypothetical protein
VKEGARELGTGQVHVRTGVEPSTLTLGVHWHSIYLRLSALHSQGKSEYIGTMHRENIVMVMARGIAMSHVDNLYTRCLQFAGDTHCLKHMLCLHKDTRT